METVLKVEYEQEKFVSSKDILDNGLEIVMEGQTVDRSMEDRDVYLMINNRDTVWLRGEEAIELGMMLIKHGNRALTANMLNHQHIHMYRRLKDYLREERIETVIMEMVDEKPANHGSGFRTYSVTPTWIKGMEPMYDEKFNFETVIYWSPFERDFKEQLEKWGGDKVIIKGYNREEELERFNNSCISLKD